MLYEVITVILGFLSVIGLSVLEWVPLFKGLLIMLVALLLTRVLTLAELRRRFPLEIWLVVGGALALADQLEATGLAKLLAAELMDHFNVITSYSIHYTKLYEVTLALSREMISWGGMSSTCSIMLTLWPMRSTNGIRMFSPGVRLRV